MRKEAPCSALIASSLSTSSSLFSMVNRTVSCARGGGEPQRAQRGGQHATWRRVSASHRGASARHMEAGVGKPQGCVSTPQGCGVWGSKPQGCVSTPQRSRARAGRDETQQRRRLSRGVSPRWG
eukprot:2768081-Prymnesium_polylepis.1